MNKAQLIAQLLPATRTQQQVKASAWHFAPSNIALCKYWGKRDAELNLPVNGSLSVSLAHLGTRTRVMPIDAPADEIVLNDQLQSADQPFAQRAIRFIDMFRADQPQQKFRVETQNNIPTAAGLASSASGFAALTLALIDALALDLTDAEASVLARIGSGSACRSLFNGFVEWQMGRREDGMDSHAVRLDVEWPEFCIGLVKVDVSQKTTDSRSGMNRTTATSHLYQSWPAQAAKDLETIRQAIFDKDFITLGATAEQNSLSMHATMISSWPPLLYWQPQSIAMMQRVWALREAGVNVYFTMDAGPNLKLLFTEDCSEIIKNEFQNLEIIRPFS